MVIIKPWLIIVRRQFKNSMEDLFTEKAGARWKIVSQDDDLWMMITNSLIFEAQSLSERDSQLVGLGLSQAVLEQKVSDIIQCIKTFAGDIDFGDEQNIEGVDFGPLLERILGRQLVKPVGDLSLAKNFAGMAGMEHMGHLRRGQYLSAFGKANAEYAIKNRISIRVGIAGPGSSDFEGLSPHLEVQQLSCKQVFQYFVLYHNVVM